MNQTDGHFALNRWSVDLQ